MVTYTLTTSDSSQSSKRQSKSGGISQALDVVLLSAFAFFAMFLLFQVPDADFPPQIAATIMGAAVIVLIYLMAIIIFIACINVWWFRWRQSSWEPEPTHYAKWTEVFAAIQKILSVSGVALGVIVGFLVSPDTHGDAAVDQKFLTFAVWVGVASLLWATGVYYHSVTTLFTPKGFSLITKRDRLISAAHVAQQRDRLNLADSSDHWR